jgi:hypothetical protein
LDNCSEFYDDSAPILRDILKNKGAKSIKLFYVVPEEDNYYEVNTEKEIDDILKRIQTPPLPQPLPPNWQNQSNIELVKLLAEKSYELNKVGVKDTSLYVQVYQNLNSKLNPKPVVQPIVQPTALVSTANGTIGYANMLNQTRVNDWEVNTGSGWAWGFRGNLNFSVDSASYSSAGMSQQVYKVRYHFSSLSVTDDSAQFFVTGYSGPVYKTKAQMMLEFTQNGYVDFEYVIPFGVTIQFGAYANTENSISYNVSKIEILPV